MRDTKHIPFVVLLLSILFPGFLWAQELPSKEQILEKMTLANKYFMDKWPDPGVDIVTDKRRPSNIWTMSTYFEGLMALYKVAPSTS